MCGLAVQSNLSCISVSPQNSGHYLVLADHSTSAVVTAYIYGYISISGEFKVKTSKDRLDLLKNRDR
jgi:hypothetical protein